MICITNFIYLVLLYRHLYICCRRDNDKHLFARDCAACRYLLQPREGARRSSGGSSSSALTKVLGSVRLNLNYSCTHVFQSSLYQQLRQLLLDTATARVRQLRLGTWFSLRWFWCWVRLCYAMLC